MCDLDKRFKEVQELRNELNMYHTELQSNLSIVDKEIVDLEHYIEFYNFNASQGFKAYKMLQEKLIKRRELKKSIEKCNIIWNGNIRDFAIGKSIDKQMKNIENKKYTARILKELFDNQ